jgi:hypothetical protein
MKASIRTLFISLTLLTGVIPTQAQGNAFTYQGQLTDNGNAYTGNAEFQATLWSVPSGGTALATNSPTQVIVGVTNGLFVLPLNFGANFPGAERWLQLEVRTTIGAFTTLAPRQPLTATPYAITASNLSGTLPTTQLSGAVASANLAGTYSGALTLNNAANSFGGSGAGLTALNASQLTSGTVPDARLEANVARTNQVWLRTGNADTTPGVNFIGTTDTNALEFKVNGQRNLRIEYATNASFGSSPNLVGGHPNNIVSNGFVGAVIGGGGLPLAPNRVGNHFATVVGGFANNASGYSATAIGNGARARGDYSIAMGNSTEASGGASTAMGSITKASGSASTAMGAETEASGDYSTAMGLSTEASSLAATAMGSATTASGDYSTAMGRRAKALNGGSYVWADSQNADFESQRANQFRVRADGGARFDFNASEWVDLRYQSNLFTSPRIISTSSGGYLSLGGAWVNASDRERKTHFTPVDPQTVLAKVTALPLSEWSYRNEGESVRHVGPMAQEFHAAFGLGGDDKSITTVDADGVALAAIQGLNHKVESGKQKVESLEQRLEQKETEITELRQTVYELKELVQTMNCKFNGRER